MSRPRVAVTPPRLGWTVPRADRSSLLRPGASSNHFRRRLSVCAEFAPAQHGLPVASSKTSMRLTIPRASTLCRERQGVRKAVTIPVATSSSQRPFSVLNRPPPNYPGHVPLTHVERAGLAIGSGIMSLVNPYRGGKPPSPEPTRNTELTCAAPRPNRRLRRGNLHPVLHPAPP